MITLQAAAEAVLSLDDLTPSPRVNRLFSELVETVIDSSDEAFMQLDAKLVHQVRMVASASESALERYWTTRILQSNDPTEALSEFPYRENYALLTQREIEQAAQSGLILTPQSRILVIGAGPLPLSSIELWRQTGALVDDVDSSALASDLSRQLRTALSMPGTVKTAAGASVQLESSYDLILIAALAGSNVDEKQAIISQVLPHLKRGGRIILRSAAGARQLLYPSFNKTQFEHTKTLSVYNPDDEVINSVIVLSAILDV